MFAVALLTASVLATGCLHGGPPEGSALVVPPPGLAGFGPIPPNQQIESLDVDLQNASSLPVRLVEVIVEGTGIGEVGRILNMEIAPTRVVDVGTDTIPDGEWVTYPPVAFFENRCNVQQLLPLRGYVLRPNSAVRVALRLQALEPGIFEFTSVDVRYEADGKSYRQIIANGLKFTVRSGVPSRKVSPIERPCLSHTTILPMGR